MGNIIFKASVSWMRKGVYCEGGTRNFSVGIDEPLELGGENKAMNPVEMLLCSLGGGLCVCAASLARKCNVELNGFSVDLEGDFNPDGFSGKDPNARVGYEQIRYLLKIDSPSPQENIDRLIELIEERCPVSDTLGGVEVIAKDAVLV